MQPIPAPDADLLFDPAFLEDPEVFEALRVEVPWSQGAIRMFGREIPEPRLSCWMGDAGASYRYSGRELTPLPWTPGVAAVRAAVEEATGAAFNSVLVNLYRDGADAMGWHADDERELGAAPAIASLSLGAPRRFLLKHKRDKTRRIELSLGGGSLLLMRGPTQACWLHSVPRTKRAVGPRINLTFRRVISPG